MLLYLARYLINKLKVRDFPLLLDSTALLTAVTKYSYTFWVYFLRLVNYICQVVTCGQLMGVASWLKVDVSVARLIFLLLQLKGQGHEIITG